MHSIVVKRFFKEIILSFILFALISHIENICCMAAFFIIPVSLTLSEIIVILLVILLVFGLRRLPELLLNIRKGIEYFKEELKN